MVSWIAIVYRGRYGQGLARVDQGSSPQPPGGSLGEAPAPEGVFAPPRKAPGPPSIDEFQGVVQLKDLRDLATNGFKVKIPAAAAIGQHGVNVRMTGFVHALDEGPEQSRSVWKGGGFDPAVPSLMPPTQDLTCWTAVGCLLSCGTSGAPPRSCFTETWESYASGCTSCGSWQQRAGSSGGITRPGADGMGLRSSIALRCSGPVPASAGEFHGDELGVAPWEADSNTTPPEEVDHYLLKRVLFFSFVPQLSLGSRPPLSGSAFELTLEGFPERAYQVQFSEDLTTRPTTDTVSATNATSLWQRLLGLVLGVVCATISLPADVFNMPPGLRSLEVVLVADPGNPPDDTGHGGVGYPYRIGRFEVTAAQYVAFLNAKAKADPDGGLWNNDMDTTRSGSGMRCDIRRQGEKGSYTYSVAPEFANRPVSHVSFWDACRFCNWLHNGQGDGDTETGAYTLKGYSGLDGRRIERNPGARWFIPTEDEWYKAAYYDPQKAGGAGYWDYPTRSDAKPSRDFAAVNAANYYEDGYLDPKYFFTEVGAFAMAPSAYGTFDQGGNVYEWTEGLVPPFLRCLWGGSCRTRDAGRNRRALNQDLSSRSDAAHVGFRIAGTSPGAGVVAAAPSGNRPTADAVPLSFPRRPWLDPVTGRPFFPLAWFVWTSDEGDLDQMAKEGVNLVLFVEAFNNVDDDSQVTNSTARMTKYLDHAHRLGIKVLPQIGGWYGAFMRSDVAEIARQKQWVEAVRQHPALLGYQLYDEPEYKAGGGLGAEDQAQLAAFVDGLSKSREALRQWDTNRNHLLQVVFNLVPLSSWTAFLPVVDALQIDRYPCDASQAYFGHRGDWGPLMMAWSIAHGAAALRDHPHLHNPAPCLQGVGLSHTESGQLGVWRNPLYEETRYMAYSSLTVGGWGVFHWIRNASCPDIRRNVARLYAELRQLLPALEQSYVKPPFMVRHDHLGISRDFLTDSVPDITTLALEDAVNCYLIAVDNSGVLEKVTFRLQLPQLSDTRTRHATVLNEDWTRELRFSAETGEWILPEHTMCFGDVNVWVIPKVADP